VSDPAAPGRSHVLVLGVGNPLMSDDGVGQRLLEVLAAQVPELDGVEYLDAGTLSLLLLPYVERCDALLVLDAAQLGSSPGTLRVFETAAMDEFLKVAPCSVHEVGMRDLLDAARLTGALPARRALVGVQPALVQWGESLSPAVAAAVPGAVAAARALLEQWAAPR